jgi:hypothetical protein
MEFVRLGHGVEDPGGGERENSLKFFAFLAFCMQFSLIKVILRLGHVAEDGGESENSTCAFRRELYVVCSSRARC